MVQIKFLPIIGIAITVEVEASDTVMAVKQKIQEKQASLGEEVVPAERMLLGSATLNDNNAKFLESEGISPYTQELVRRRLGIIQSQLGQVR